MSIGRWFLVVGLLAGSVGCALLGRWQWQRLEARLHWRDRILKSRSAPSLDLGFPLPVPVDSLDQRPARVLGHFDSAHNFVVRARSWQGENGVAIVTPLHILGGGAVLVERGWVPSPDGVRVYAEAQPETGLLVVRGFLSIPPPGTPGESNYQGHLSFGRLDPAAMGRHLGYPVLPVGLLRIPEASSNGFPRAFPAEDPGEGPHRGYALQWFGFAVIALLGAVAVARHPQPATFTHDA